MSEQNVEAVRGVYERWADGDFRGGIELFHPEIEFVMRPGFPDAGTYLGPEGVARYMKLFLEPWDRITIEAEALTDVGDAVVATVRQSGTGMGSGAATELRYFQAWTFRDGRVIRLENIRGEEEAFESVRES